MQKVKSSSGLKPETLKINGFKTSNINQLTTGTVFNDSQQRIYIHTKQKYLFNEQSK